MRMLAAGPEQAQSAHVGRSPPGPHCTAGSSQLCAAPLPTLPCWEQSPCALLTAPLLSLQAIIPLMKFLESELQYLNEHLVQENFKR